MTYMDLQALRHYVRKAQKIIYELVAVSLSSVIMRMRLHCELTNHLLKFIQYEINRYDAKGELKDDNN